MPYISTTPAKLRNPCTGDQNCTSPFSYKNVLSLTSEGNKFNELVGKQHISGNLDSPEGGLCNNAGRSLWGKCVLLFFYCSIRLSCLNAALVFYGGWHLNMSPPASQTG